MSKIKRYLVLPAALMAMIAISSVSQAQCTSCSSASSNWQSSGCSSCSSGGGAVGSGHLQGAFEKLKAKYHKNKADFHLITARNQAWPLPFSCQDRDIYYRILNQQLQQGLMVGHTLTSDAFDPETNELNYVGEAKVAWIMQKAPLHSRQIFVYEDQTTPTMQQRMQNIKKVVDRWYGHMEGVEIATTQTMPNGIPAYLQEPVTRQYIANQPTPVVPITLGSSLSSGVSN